MKSFAAAILLLLTPSAFAELVTNGSFETGPTITPPDGFVTLTAVDSTSISNWTISSGSLDYIGGATAYWQAADGSASLDMNGTNAAATIEQTITTLLGHQYTLFFMLSVNPDGGVDRTINFDAISNGGAGSSDFGGAQTQTANFTGQTTTNMGWQQYAFIFYASSTSTLLTFSGDADASSFGPALDQVSVLETPEPSAFLLFGAGLAGLGGLALRRRSQSKKTRAAKA